MRPIVAVLPVAAALVAAGCGGAERAGSAPAGASVVPARVIAFVSVDTDLDSAQWKQASALLDRFPGRDELLSRLREELGKQSLNFERDVRPALGQEVDAAVLDLSGATEAIGLTRPKDPAKLAALLRKLDESDPGSGPTVTATFRGWTLVSDSRAKLAAFERAAAGSKLAGVEAFRDEMGRLPDDTLAKAYVNGRAVQAKLDHEIAASGGAAGVTSRDFFTFSSLGAAALAQDDGVRAEVHAALRLVGSPRPFEARLPEELPAGALLYVSFSHLDTVLRRVLETVARTNPGFEEQRSTVEAVLGISLDEDVVPQFKGESGFAIYPASPIANPAVALPTFEFVQVVTDEDKVRSLLARIGPIAKAGGGVDVRTVGIGRARAYEFPVPGEDVSIYYGVLDGKLVVSNSRAAFAGLQSSGPRLADERLFKAAEDGADAPDKATGFVYANLERGLPLAFDFAEASQTVPPEARANTRPLRSALLSFTAEGDRFDLSAFLGIK